MLEIVNQEELDDFICSQPATALWFSAPDCNVCRVLLPKVREMLEQEFPRLALAQVNCPSSPSLAATQGVFSIPTLLFCFDGREAQRFVRNFSLGQVREALERPYALLFE